MSAPQAFPQAPQFALSFWRSTHWPLHHTWPAAQTDTQAPPLQHVPSPQTLPQAPQFPLSFWRSAQAAPHQVRPAEHSEAHPPAEQHVPEPQC